MYEQDHLCLIAPPPTRRATTVSDSRAGRLAMHRSRAGSFQLTLLSPSSCQR
ncbi:hypothetical protein BDW72DRAFT_178200, partial [Aspergillus terricola var. indicus]